MTKIDLSLENNSHLLEQKDQSQELFRGNFLNLLRDTVKMPMVHWLQETILPTQVQRLLLLSQPIMS
mgnify:CR=1 FL=1